MATLKMGSDPVSRGPRQKPRPIGVYAEGRKAQFVLTEADASALGRNRELRVLRGARVLGFALAGEESPLFMADLEAELDLRLAERIEILVVDHGIVKPLEGEVRLLWP